MNGIPDSTFWLMRRTSGCLVAEINGSGASLRSKKDENSVMLASSVVGRMVACWQELTPVERHVAAYIYLCETVWLLKDPEFAMCLI